MLSIIIASVNKFQLKNISENIAATVGVAYEIIATENSGAKKGICQIYNEGIDKAKYDILCFIHEDIHIKTDGWGNTLVSLFTDARLGLVGVAGAAYLPISPSSGGGVNSNAVYMNILQSYKFQNKETIHDYLNPRDEKLSEVAYADGVWLCTTKKVAAEFKFDTKTCPGFHGYDVDFSLAIGTKYKVAVTFEILINHYSEGNFDRTWMEDIIRVFNKWNSRLPLNIERLTPAQSYLVEKLTFKRFIEQLLLFKLPVSFAFNTLWKNNTFFRYNAKLFLKLNFFTFKQIPVFKRNQT
jgi:hypothetical protein